jgi:transposase-like protein
MIARLICWLVGHKRGIRFTDSTVTTTAQEARFRCPRCKDTWSRKVYARKGKA